LKILVSNDDGIHSPGLHILAERLGDVGEVYVVAPDRERNAAGHSLTLHKPLRAECLRDRVYSINGTPTDCVNLGVNHLLRERPALVVSGINKGGNLGDDVTYSGTVSAAMEGLLLGIPSFAISLVGEKDFRFQGAADFALRLAVQILKRGLPSDTFLNVNVPNLPADQIRGVQFTSLGKRIYDENIIVEKTDPRGKNYYWIAGNRIRWAEGKETDHMAIESQKISVTPLHLDLTHYDALQQLKDWLPDLNRSV
jgi:5'-nucleotidase